jgi:hypothetical protein
MSAAENSFATSGKQTLAATTLEVAVAPISLKKAELLAV